MGQLDIVARLQLRAEQFSSETGARFAEMKTRAASTAQEVRQSFSNSFGEVERLAAKSLTLPRTTTGSLDLSSEIGQLKQAAVASDQRATALRELSIAQSAAAVAGRADAEALRLEADAAAIGALAAERDAQANRDRVTSLEAVQAQLNKTTSSTNLLNEAGARHVVSAGQQRASTMMLGQQVQDFAVQAANGGSIATAFSQQVGQAGFALAGMGGKAAAVGAFLGTGWGATVLVGLTVFTPLVAKIFEGNNALDDAVEKLKKDAAASEINRQAKARFATTMEGVAAAIRDGTDATNKAIEAEKTSAEQSNIAAKQALARQVVIRQTTVALLEQAEAEARAANATNFGAAGGAGAAAAQTLYGTRAAEYRTMADKARQDLQAAEARVNATRIDLAAESAARAVDPMARIKKLYDDQVNAAKAKARAEGSVTTELTRQLTAIERNRQAAVKTEQARQSAERSAARAGPLTSFLSPVSGARTTGGYGERRPDHIHQGVDYAVPVGTPVRAPAAGTVDVAGQRQGYGNAIYINFGGGTSARFGHLSKFNVKPGDTVEAGDVIGYTGRAAGAEGSGRSTGPHLHYEVRRNGRAVDPRTGRFPTDAGAAGDDATRRQEAAEKKATAAAEKQQREAEEVARKVGAIGAEWNDQPRLIDRATAATGFLDDQIADLRKKPLTPDVQKSIDDLNRLKETVRTGVAKPFDDMIQQQERGLAVQRLVLRGRDAEANALQDQYRLMDAVGAKDAEQLQTILAKAGVEGDVVGILQRQAREQDAISRAIEDQRRQIGLYLGAVDDAQRTFESFLSTLQRGKVGSAGKGLLKDLLGDFRGLDTRIISEKLFGGLDREIEQMLRGKTPLDKANDYLARQANRAGTSLDGFVGGLDRATARLNGGVANDNGAITGEVAALLGRGNGSTTLGGVTISPALAKMLEQGNGVDDVVVTANTAALKAATGATLGAKDAYNLIGGKFADRLAKVGIQLPKGVSDELGKLGTYMQGAALGSVTGKLGTGALGVKGSQLGGTIGGALGERGGEVLQKGITAVFGKTLGSFAGPLGAIAGSVLGSVVGGLFKSTKSGSATLGSVNGAAGVTGTSGNAYRAASSAAGGQVADNLNSIIEQLGGTLGSFAVSSSKRGDTYSIDRSGRGKTKGDGSGGDVASGLTLDEAQQRALADAIADGAVAGISAASQKILKSGQDLGTAIAKASLIESVPKMLKERLDPVGAAVDEVTKKFDKIFAALKEGGATAEQTAQAQQLMNLELDDAKTKTASASAGLKSFLDGLKVGSSSPLSLRDQEVAAKTALQPFLDKIAGGQSIDQDKYQAAAQSYLDVERQLNGSNSAFFAEFDRIQAATAKAIDKIDNVASISGPGSVGEALAAQTAKATQATAEIGAQTNDLLSQVVSLLRQAPIPGNPAPWATTTNDFIGQLRNFKGYATL